MAKKQLPQEDIDLINDAFKETGDVETLGKDASGNLKKAEMKKVNESSYVIKDFSGKTLRHHKSLIPKGGEQITIGVKGQKYDDIPLHLRNQVVWVDSDFE